MQLKGSDSYTIRMGDPYVLQFAAFIGLKEGFNSAPTSQPVSPAEAQWLEWWLALPASILERNAYLQEAIKDSAGKPDPGLMQKANPSNYGYNPPTFSAIPEDKLALRELCLKYHPQFVAWNQQEQPKIEGQTRGFTERIKLHKMIEGIEKANGRKARAFKLRLDFVYWPENYLRVISDNHFVLTAPYGSPEKEQKLKELLQTYISKLA